MAIANDFTSKTSQNGAATSNPGLLRGGSLVLGVEVSALTSEAHEMSAQMTQVAMESGALLNDHVIIQHPAVTVTFVMTNTGGGADTARDIFETFKRMMEERKPLELITQHYVYDNMVIVGLSPLHQAPYKGALTVSLRLQQASFVQLAATGRSAGRLKGKASKSASGKVDAGKQDAKEINKDSWLSQKAGIREGKTRQSRT